MNKAYLQSKLKSTGTAYLLMLFVFGSHYAYLGKWGIQFLFWITFGGLGLWWLIDLFSLSSKVENYNSKILIQIDDLEKKEREDSHAKNIAMITASRG